MEGVLREWYRALKPGGILRIAVPNFEVLSSLYSGGTINIDKVLGPLYGRMPMENSIIYHKTVYDFKSLKEILESCKFTNVQYYDWRETEHAQFDDHSQAYIPHLDKEDGVLISLNIECLK